MALNFLSNGIFAGDVTIPEYIYHTGNTSQDKFGFAGNDTFVISTNGTDKFTADANSAILLEAGAIKLQTTSTGVGITGTATATTFSGAVSTGNTDGQGNIPFKLSVDYNSYMVAAAGSTWGLFWAGNSGARYGTNGNGGPGNIWGNNGNPNEFVFVGGDSTRWTVNGNTGDTWQSGDIYVGGGDIILSGTGRIQGVGTVSDNTDAANKLYVDDAVAASPQGTVTISGTPVNNQLAVWTSATSIEGESELTYDGSTFTVGGTGNTTTYLDVIGTNTAGAPATAAAIRIYGYEGRGEGIFYYDSAYASSEWYSGVPYSGGDTWQIGHDTGGQAQYTANAVMTMNASKNTFFAGNVDLGDSSNITMAVGAPGQLRIKGSGYSGAIALDATAMYIYHDSSLRDLVLGTNEAARLTIDGSSGNATFASSLTIPDYVIHTGDTTTRFGFAAADTFQIDTDGSLRFGVNNSGMKLGGANARVTTIYDQDNMSSNSATALATQQSIKQYVDTAVSNAGTVTGTGVAGRVAFWNATTSLSADSNLYWDDSNNELGIGTSSPTTFLTVAGGHSTTRANLFYNDAANIRKAFIDMWASEPGVSYNGSGIGSNILGSPYYGRKVTEQGQTYIRFIDGQFEVYTGTNSSGTGSTAAKRFQITDSGLATFYQIPVVGTMATSDNSTRSASTAFVTTAIGNVSTGVQSVGGTANRISSSGGTAPVIDAITGTVSITSANLATGAQIQTAINEATTGALKFVSEWSASGTAGGSPDLRVAGTHVPGNYYIVSAAGSATPNGAGTTPNEWAVGDWCIRADLATDTWQKIDNTQVGNVTGTGLAGRVAYWSSNTNITNDADFTFDGADLTLGTQAGTTAARLVLYGTTANNAPSVIQTTNGNLHIDPDTGHGTFLNYFTGDTVYIGTGAGGYSGTQFNASGDVTIGDELTVTTINNATTDTDKFLVSDSGVVKYRTGAQVLSDIGAQAFGNYLPVANPTFTGTLTGPAATITGTATVGGATLSGNTFSDPDLLLSVLSNDTTASIRNKISVSTALTKVTDSTAPAPGVFQVSGAYNVQFGDYHTIDEGDTFTFEFWYKWHSGDSTYNLLYAGSSFYNAAGQYLGNTQRYWGESALNINANSGSDWYHVTGTLGPNRGNNTGDIPTTAVSMQLLFLFNYAPNGTSVTRFCGLKVYKSGQTVTQLYRKTLGSEANTTRNRDLVVDANGDLYGAKINATGNVTFAAGLQVTSPGVAFYNKFRSGNDYVIGLQDSAGNDQWWLKAYTNGSFALHENSVGDKFTIAAGGATTIGGTLTVDSISNASASNTFLVSDSGLIKYRTAAQVLSDIGAASSGSLGNYLPLAGGTMSGTIVSTATTALEMDGAAAAQGILMQADSSGTYPVFLRSLNPASGGETSPWLYKETSTPWGIWHNNPSNSFDFTRSGNNLGIANNVGGQTNSVMIRLNSTDGSGTFAGNVIATGDVTADQFFSTNNGNGQNYKIGDDVYIGDINVANTFRVQGAQNPNNGYITFGNSSNTQLGRAGTGALTWGGAFEVTTSVTAPTFIGNATTATTFNTGRTNYKGVTDGAVIGMMMWKNYGNDHVIFDASNSTSPSGGAISNTDSTIAWTGTYPTLMGWNGTSTYGVRVDRARLADNATTAAAYLPLVGGTLTGGLTGTSVTMSGGIKANEGMFNNVDGLRLINPGGGSSVGQISTVTGAIKITLPVTHTNTMMRMTIKVYEYTTNESFTVVLGGYNYSSGNTWYNCFAHIESNATVDRNFTVRFGYASSKGQIYIGELNSQWSYPQVFVTDFQAGYSSYTASSWQTGWDVNFETSAFGSVTRSIANPQVNNWARDGANLNYTSGSGNVLVTTQPAGQNDSRAASTAFVTAAVAAVPIGNYLPIANPTFTGTLTGPIATISSSATNGEPVLNLQQAGTQKASLQFIDGTNTTTDPDRLVLTSVPSSFTINTNSADRIRIDTVGQARIGVAGNKTTIGADQAPTTVLTVFDIQDTSSYSGINIKQYNNPYDNNGFFGMINAVGGTFNIVAKSGGTIKFMDGQSSATNMEINGSGDIKFNNYGAGTLVTDASGNVTAATSGAGTGSVTSVKVVTDGDALNVASNIITVSGTMTLPWQGGSNQYVNGLGNAIDFPTIPQGTVTGTGTANLITKWNSAGTGIEDTSISVTESGTARLYTINGGAGASSGINILRINKNNGGSGDDSLVFRLGTTQNDIVSDNNLDTGLLRFRLANAAGTESTILSLNANGDSIFSGNVTVGANTTQNGTNPGLKIQSTNTAQTVLGLHNTTSRNWEVAVGGSASGIGAGSFYIYDNTANDARFIIDTSGNATVDGTVTANGVLLTGGGEGVTSVATTSPILGGTITTSGTISLLQPASGAWFRGVSVIGSDGLMEVGRYIDFHNSNTSTADYDVRLDCYSANNLRLTGSLNVTQDIVVNSQLGVGITPAAGISLEVNGKIRADDSNSGDYIQMYCDGSGTGDSFIENTNSSIIIKSANATTKIDASGAAANLEVLNASNVATIRLRGAADSFIAGGDLGIGNTGPVSGIKLDVTGKVLIKTSDGVSDLYMGNYSTAKYVRFHTNNSNTYFDMNCGHIYWRLGSSTKYDFDIANGNMQIDGTLTQSSDIRLKENITEISDCISKVQAMRGVYYNKTESNTEDIKIGVIAQEVEAVLPELVIESPETGLKSVAYSELTAVLINAIKEQQEIIEDLKTRITKLEN